MKTQQEERACTERACTDGPLSRLALMPTSGAASGALAARSSSQLMSTRRSNAAASAGRNCPMLICGTCAGAATLSGALHQSSRGCKAKHVIALRACAASTVASPGCTHSCPPRPPVQTCPLSSLVRWGRARGGCATAPPPAACRWRAGGGCIHCAHMRVRKAGAAQVLIVQAKVSPGGEGGRP